jgi:8-oxo-dGTP diphosphatase
VWQIVNGLLIRRRTVLLARRAPHRKAYPDLWSFPGGHVEPNETLDEALVRELREEIGITATRYTSLGPIAKVDDPATWFMYAIRGWDGGEPMMIGNEHTELRWFTLEAAATLHDLALEEYRRLFIALIDT